MAHNLMDFKYSCLCFKASLICNSKQLEKDIQSMKTYLTE